MNGLCSSKTLACTADPQFMRYRRCTHRAMRAGESARLRRHLRVTRFGMNRRQTGNRTTTERLKWMPQVFCRGGPLRRNLGQYEAQPRFLGFRLTRAPRRINLPREPAVSALTECPDRPAPSAWPPAPPAGCGIPRNPAEYSNHPWPRGCRRGSGSSPDSPCARYCSDASPRSLS